MLLLPQFSSLFPYTTLFRSDMTRKQAELKLHDVKVPFSALLGAPGSGEHALARMLDLAKVALGAEQVGGAERCLDMSIEDRKSTRLNSSHIVISYAVSCLKR